MTSTLTQKIDSHTFELFSRFLNNEAGIQLGPNKQYLVETRIRKILIDYKIASIKDLIEAIELPKNRQLKQIVIDAMTTNETFWFRDVYPFEYLKKTILPEFSKNKPNQRLRIWSSACSSGQEPYSISIIIEELCKSVFSKNVDVEIIATDLSHKIMSDAKSAKYDKISVVRGLSSQRLRDYFDQNSDNSWQVKPGIKKRVQFRTQNLKGSYGLLGKFDVVFCRNVLIYFSGELKLEIIKKIHRTMEKGGYLFLGSSESLGNVTDLFEMVHCSPGVVYRAK